MHVEISFEDARWCGYRSPAKNGLGLYLIGSGDFEPCERLPFPLEVCPCCGAGVKPARSFTWISPPKLLDPWTAQPLCCEVVGDVIDGLEHDHAKCAMCNPIVVAGEEAGLLWIGEKFYKRADDFMHEAMRMGISRKIPALPQGFEVGKHYVYLAHRKTVLRRVENEEPQWVQGIFTAFRPARLDIVIDDPDDVPQEAIDLAKRVGDCARLVKVIPVDDDEGATDGDEW